MAWIGDDGSVIASEEELQQFRDEGFTTQDEIAAEIKRREWVERLQYFARAKQIPKPKRRFWWSKTK